MSDIVIDADIMRSAGTSEHPHSRNSRQVLEALRDGNHRMVQCAPLLEEHKKHRSRFASIWQTSMLSRKQWVRWEYKEDANLRRVLVAALPEEANHKEQAVLKDAHLLEAAAATGQCIISKDRTARDLFQLACPSLASHRHILWGEMTLSADAVIDWVKSGCGPRSDFKLCPPPPESSGPTSRRRAAD
jgi:predicted nucleic acid-binding protein